MKPLLVLGCLLAVAFAGCVGDEPAPTTSAPPSSCEVPARSTLTLENGTNPLAVWETSMGCFAAELFAHKAPITAGNFANLTKTGFYNGTRFHRVIEGFMIQDGDPLSKDTSSRNRWGTGGPGYAIKDEFVCKDGFVSNTHPGPNPATTASQCNSHGGFLWKHDRPGRISMANSGPSSGGSQYFIVIKPAASYPTHLDGRHPIFGQIVWNQDKVEAIGKTPTNPSDQPLTDVVIKSMVLR